MLQPTYFRSTYERSIFWNNGIIIIDWHYEAMLRRSKKYLDAVLPKNRGV